MNSDKKLYLQSSISDRVSGAFEKIGCGLILLGTTAFLSTALYLMPKDIEFYRNANYKIPVEEQVTSQEAKNSAKVAVASLTSTLIGTGVMGYAGRKKYNR